MAALAFAVLVGLGAWQLIRLEGKTAQIETVAARLSRPAVPLPVDWSDPASHDLQPVHAQDASLGERVLYLTGGSPAGRAGLRVLAASEVAGQSAPILVDLGWIPLGRKGEPLDLPDRPVDITGVLRVPAPPGWLTSDNDPGTNMWKWADLPAMGDALGVGAPAPLLLRAERIARDDGTPILDDGLERGPIAVDLRNDHLHYAITWFALALGLLVIYVLFVRRRLSERENAAR